MRPNKAFTFYYLLPFMIYIVFAAILSPTTFHFWGLLVIGTFFALSGLFLMKNSFEKTEKPEPVQAVQEVKEPEPLPQPPEPVVVDLSREKELEEKLRLKDEELLALRQQCSILQSDLSKTDVQLKTREAAIQELRFEVRSLLAISRGKSPATS